MPRTDHFRPYDNLSSLIQVTPDLTDRGLRMHQADLDMESALMQRDVTNSMEQLLDTQRKLALGDMQQQALREEADILPRIKALDSRADDYENQLTELISAAPLGSQSKAVQDIIQIQTGARNHIMQARERTALKAQAEAERDQNKLDALRLDMAKQGSDALARYERHIKDGLDPFTAAAHVASADQTQKIEVSLAKAGVPTSEIDKLRDPATKFIDRIKAESVLADFKGSKIDDDIGRMAFQYVDSINKRRADIAAGKDISPLTEEEEALYKDRKELSNAWFDQKTKEFSRPTATQGTTSSAKKRIVIGPDGKPVK